MDSPLSTTLLTILQIQVVEMKFLRPWLLRQVRLQPQWIRSGGGAISQVEIHNWGTTGEDLYTASTDVLAHIQISVRQAGAGFQFLRKANSFGVHCCPL